MGSGGFIVWEGDVGDQHYDGSGADHFWVGDATKAADAVGVMGEKFLPAIENRATRSAWEVAVAALDGELTLDVAAALLEVESGETVISTKGGRFARVEKEGELYRLEFGTEGLGLDRENSAAGLYTREAIIEQMAVWGKADGWEVLVYE
jgi:hypothetical protein